MLHLAPPVTLRLEPGRLVALQRQAPLRLRVVAGTAWVTQTHDMEDHFLRPGDAIELRAGARALIGAEHGEASIRFEAERGFSLRGLWRRLRAAHARQTAPLPSGIRPA